MRRCENNPEHKLSGQDTYCEECGGRAMFVSCPNGHEVFNIKAKFCWKCGTELNKNPDPKAVSG